MGGYPRIGCLISPDIPAIAQLKSGKKIKFKFISRDEANKIVSEDGKKLETITQRCHHVGYISTSPSRNVSGLYDSVNLLVTL